MNTIVIHSGTNTLVRPEPRSPITIRPAVLGGGDLLFIDALMKQHSEMVGFATTTELMSHIEEGTALIALDASEGPTAGEPLGYILYRDRYMKREDCGYVSQLNVVPHRHRGLVGAALVKAMFERLPYGVRLFSCWCAQDLEANQFWESVGFVPLAYRAGSRGKAQGGTGGRKETRVHIFWQRRVREGDEYAYWFPSQTHAGRMGEGRIVLPIMPGTHWSDAKALVLPGGPVEEGSGEVKALPREKKTREKKVKVVETKPKRPSKGLWFAPPAAAPAPASSTPSTSASVEAKPKPAKPKRAKQKNDPRYIAAARELRDKFIEQMDAGLILPPSSNGKYDVGRQLPAAIMDAEHSPLLLNAA